MTYNFDTFVNSILNEGVVDDLFKDPNNNDLKFDQVIAKFRKSGGQVLGSGAYATTLTHDNWNYVLKLFHNDSSYVTYARYCYRNQNNPCVPRMLDMPRKILPNYTRNGLDNKFLYYVKMEKLEEISDRYTELQQIYSEIDMDFHSLISIVEQFSLNELLSLNIDDKLLDNNGKHIIEKLRNYKKYYPWVMDYCKLLFDINAISKKIGARTDLHEGNVMIREKDDVLVITDPLAYGREKDVKKKDIYQLIRTVGLYRDDALSVKGGKNISRKKLKTSIEKTPPVY